MSSDGGARPPVSVHKGGYVHVDPTAAKGTLASSVDRWYGPQLGAPRCRIEIAAEGVRVVARTGATWSLAREHVELVGRVKNGRNSMARSLVFLLVGGGTWNVWLGPVKLLKVFEAYGWPVDETALLTGRNAEETAVAMVEPLPPPPAS